MPTLDHWHGRGCLVARGVLVDYKAWYEQKAVAEGKSGKEAIFHPYDGHRISVADIEAVAKHQNVEFRPGDVLIVRTGETEILEAGAPTDFARLKEKSQLSGVEGNMTTVKWLWNKHFAAVAGDAMAFEAIPPLKENREPAGYEDLGKWTSSAIWLSCVKLINRQSCTAGSSPCSECRLASFGTSKHSRHIARR